jgi:hypothetical protein
MSTGELRPIVKSTTFVVAGERMPTRLIDKCKTRNGNNRRSECKVKADALHDKYGKRMQRAEDQRKARKAKRRK